jgi:hypothetical protein
MLKKLIFAAGASYLWRKFSGSRRTEPSLSRTGSGSAMGSRWGRRNDW